MLSGKKIGIAFGGGGAKGAAHIGVVKYLEQKNLPISAVSGSSIGAFVAAMVAFNKSYLQIRNAFLQLEPFSIKALRREKLGLMENISLLQVLQNNFSPGTKIEDAPIPLAIHASDIETGDSVQLNQGNLIEAVMASSCVPGFYLPKEIDGRLLVDGGLTENVPVSVLRKMGADYLIGISLNGLSKYSKPANMLDVIGNAMDIAIDRQTKEQLKEADMVINLDLSHFNRLKVDNIDEMMEVAHSEIYRLDHYL